MSSEQIILHHYPQSPVTEKVRAVLGIKALSWRSVIIPRLPPKPMLMPLTGGYRLTPVMQIGADIYCDTIRIIDELERRFPSPSLFPDGNLGFPRGLAQWTDGPFFKDVVTVALVEMSPNMPPEFLADRGPLYFGPDFSLEELKARYTESKANIRTQFNWIDEVLKERKFIHGPQAGLSDALIHYLVWFLETRLPEEDRFLDQFQHLTPWRARMKQIGHGEVSEMSEQEALDIASASRSVTDQSIDSNDPLQLTAGERVSVTPVQGGPSVQGALQELSTQSVALLREDSQVGEVCVHFPRLGYRIQKS